MHHPDLHKLKLQNIFCLVLVVTFSGCSSHKHLTFENLTINGNLKTFEKEMVNMGFSEQKSYEENRINLSGLYCDKNCELAVYATPKSKTVYKVVVNLPDEVHDSVKATYEKMKKRCASIYGEGASRYQQFRNSPRFLFNEEKLVREPKPGDYTRYITRTGIIILEVRLDYLSITYLDKINYVMNKKEGGKENNMEATDIY